MRSALVIILFTLAGSANSKYSALKDAPLTFNDSDLTRLISNPELDPRLDLAVHLVIEERNKAVMILQICQSRYSSRSDFIRKLTHAGREIFVYDFSEKKIGTKSSISIRTSQPGDFLFIDI